MKQTFTIENIEGFQVVRDDLYPGGTKKRVLENIAHLFPEDIWVYPASYLGAAPYAMALVASELGKKVHLLLPAGETVEPADTFKKTIQLPNVTTEVVEGAQTQYGTRPRAKEYAEENNARLFPMGFDMPEFREELVEVVKSAEIDAPEIWCIGGSGTLARSLQKAYPDTPVYVASVHAENADFTGVAGVYVTPEAFVEKAEVTPPYPSMQEYDAKVWRFVKEHAKEGACVWNVA